MNEHFASFQSSGLDRVTMNILHLTLSLLPTQGVKSASVLTAGITSVASIHFGGDDYQLLEKKEVNQINPIVACSGAAPAVKSFLFCFSHSNRLEYSFHGNLSNFPNGLEEFVQAARQGIQEELVRLRKEVNSFTAVCKQSNGSLLRKG